MRTDRKTPASILALVVGLCGLTMALGYFNKARCGGAPFAPDGRSLNFDVNKNIDVCYSDIQLLRSEEHTSELQSLMRSSYAVFCLQKKNSNTTINNKHSQ